MITRIVHNDSMSPRWIRALSLGFGLLAVKAAGKIDHKDHREHRELNTVLAPLWKPISFVDDVM